MDENPYKAPDEKPADKPAASGFRAAVLTMFVAVLYGIVALFVAAVFGIPKH